MLKTGFLYDERYLLHITSPYHPEVPDRLKAIYKGIKDAGMLPHLTLIQACKADMSQIEMMHQKYYIQRFKQMCAAGIAQMDTPDCQICAESYEIALLAVGGILEAGRLVMESKIDNAFCAVRPPGHHAEHDRAMGFCYFANVAILAKYLQTEWGVKKVGIIDFDVHHGNGTQNMFNDDPSVFYYSIHEHPSFAFPGTGRELEKGVGAGVGTTRNYPVLPGQGDKEYLKAMREDWGPAFEGFNPDIIIVSTGFDAHEDDDMSGINLTTEGFSQVMKLIVQMADRLTGGKLISVLEGGYSLKRLPELAKNHVEILMKKD